MLVDSISYLTVLTITVSKLKAQIPLVHTTMLVSPVYLGLLGYSRSLLG